MTRQLRDIVVSVAALSLLGLMLISISPRLRERAEEYSTGLDAQRIESSESFARHTIDRAFAAVAGYARGNPYMVVFLVVASVLFVAMVKT